MSEFNELVKAFLLGNNIHYEESGNEPNMLVLSVFEKKRGFMQKVFDSLSVRKESLKIYILDGLHENITLSDDADMIIWNDSFSGKNLEERIKQKLMDKSGQLTDDYIGNIDSRFVGMGKDILFAKFFGHNRVKDLLGVGKVKVAPISSKKNEVKPVFNPGLMGQKRFAFLVEETGEEEFLKCEFNRFMEYFCNEQGKSGQSLPVFFESIDFWFGGMIHNQLTNRLNQDLGLFLTEDTVFYMVRLGYIIPFINEIDLFCGEEYLNPQAAHIAHLFHLCGDRGMLMAGCSWESLFYQDIRAGVDFEKMGIEGDSEWYKIISKPMGARLLEDEENSELIGVERRLESRKKEDAIVRRCEQKLIAWIDDVNFPILKSGDRKGLMKQIAARWMERGVHYLELEEFHSILFAFNLLPEGKRTLSHVNEIVKAMMNSGILSLSDFDQVIPVSRLMGDAIVLWMLNEEYRYKESLISWLDRSGFSQIVSGKLLKKFTQNKNMNILIPLSASILDVINSESKSFEQHSYKVMENALELYIGLKNNGYLKTLQLISGRRLYDLTMSHEIVNGLVFRQADLHNILFQQSVFIDCQFEGCNLTSSYFAGSTFLNCRFENTNLRNADFSGSYFRSCVLFNNIYEDLILIGSAFEDDCEIDLDISRKREMSKLRIWTDGSKGIPGQKKEQLYDLPVIVYLMQKRHLFYTRYGFRINADVGFHHFGKQLGTVSEEKFSEQYNYCDVYDDSSGAPELYFAKKGSVYCVKENIKKEFRRFSGQLVYIDHVVKYTAKNKKGIAYRATKILYHTPDAMFIEENPDIEQWFKSPVAISNKFVGRGVSGLFMNHDRALIATDVGGLFLFEYINKEWVSVDGKFQSEPVSKIFPQCNENMTFVKRGSSVVEIWDTLNDLSLLGKLVTSFKEILGIRLIENLNHVILYGEWADGSIGALVYNIINKHLVTYWQLVSENTIKDFTGEDFQKLEDSYKKEVKAQLEALKEKSLLKVSLADGYIQRGCKELRQIIDNINIIPPQNLTYCEGEPVEYQWRIKSDNPSTFPIIKKYIDISTGAKEEFEFEIKIGDLINVKSGKLKFYPEKDDLLVVWNDKPLSGFKDTVWGDHEVCFEMSLLGERKSKSDIIRFRPQNPFKGGISLSKEMGSDWLFVGREQELAKAVELVKNGVSFTIKGARRIGKTSFMHRLRENLPPNVIAAYISFDEFDESKSQASLLTKMQECVQDIHEKYPDIYDEFSVAFDALREAQPSLNFQWVMSMGIEKLRKQYSGLLSKIWPKIEECKAQGMSSGSLFEEISTHLKTFDDPLKVVFIIDEIGVAKKKGVTLSDVFNPFRTIIESNDTAVILAGIPYNFHELTSELDIKTDSGFMSYVRDHIVLGPLTDTECKILIRNNLSKRIQIEDDVLTYALKLSTGRPEDLQIMMHFALEDLGANSAAFDKTMLSIQHLNIEKGFDFLLEHRGYTCSKVWERISVRGKKYLKNKLISMGRHCQLLDVAIDELDFKNIDTNDIEIFKGYGFTDPAEEKLIIPMYFQEWVRRDFYKREFNKEDNHYEKN